MSRCARMLMAAGVLIVCNQNQVIAADETSKELYQTGYHQFKAGQYNTAIKTFNRCLDKDRMYWEAYWGRGFSSAKLGQFANAVNEFSRYQGFRDDYGKYGDMKPFDMNYKDECEQAAPIFSNYLKTHKKWFLYSGRAVSYMKMKKLQEAKADLDEAVKNLPQDQTVLVAAVYGMRGNCNLALGHADAALSDYDKGLSARELAPLFRARSLAYKKMGKSDLAAKDESSAKMAEAGKGLKRLLTGGSSADD